MSFLSDTNYKRFLHERINTLDDPIAKEHVEKTFELWSQQYRAHRLVERMVEMLAGEKDRPNLLYLRCEADIHLLGMLTPRHRFDGRVFRGFLAADDLRDSLKPEWFSPFPLFRASEWRDDENTVVFTLSSDSPFRDNGRDRGNDYMERFIDLSRLKSLEELRGQCAGRRLVLYADYRKVQTIAAISNEIRKSAGMATVLLANSAEASYSRMFDHVLEQPCYLWPLVFRALAPDIVHVNVGWGTQGLPFMLFVPDPTRAVVDFYDVTELVPQERQEGSLETRVLARASERYLWKNFHHVVHRCFDPVTEGLRQRHPDRDIVSLVEYVKEPTYSQVRGAGENLKIVYAGIIIQDAADQNSVYYQRFMAMADSFAKDNLHLHIYPSPYLYGFGKPKAVEELILTHRLTNVHACEPLEEDEFVRAISACDYGMSPPPDTRPCPYPDSLPYKVIAYLRAGLPIIVPEDLTYLAQLVRKYDIGVVYRCEDLDRMPEILSRQDVRKQKENVARFRSMWNISKGGEKIAALYGRMLQEGRRSATAIEQDAEPSMLAPGIAPPTASPSEFVLSLEGRTFLSDQEYAQFLEAGIESADPTMDKEYVRKRYEEWRRIYRVERMWQRAEEMLGELQGSPFALYLEDAESLHVAAQILKDAPSGRFVAFRGFVIEDDLLATLDLQQFGSYRIVPRSRSREIDVTVFSISGKVPDGTGGRCLANDYREKFIDLRRFEGAAEIRARFAEHDVVLYPMYREIQTVPMMAGFVRKKEDGLRSVSLSPRSLLSPDFDATLVEPFFYLWPLVIRTVDPALVHLNVGWGIQALALSAFVPERKRTVVDFYEVLSFLPDAFFERTHSTARQVRGAEEHFFRNYDHIMHLCSEETSTRLAAKYGSSGSIVSVTEYLQEPTYCLPPRNDGEIRLVYGGAMLAVNSPDNFYYRPFLNVVRYYMRENLQLYIYNSPYLDGTGENHGLQDVIRSHNLTHVHACRPLQLEDFVRTIAEYDFGTFLLLARDMHAGAHYNYYMAYKFLAYLRAGLPIVIDADNRYLAGLVERYNLGVVLQERDMENLAPILNGLDLPVLKRNVVEARDRFRIEKGGEKVLAMYHEILEQSRPQAMRSVAAKRRCAPNRKRSPVATAPAAAAAGKTVGHTAFEEMIQTMARKENRLYYRDQSAWTMSSLAALAQQFDPTVIVELGTLGGLSLRTWIASTKKTRIYAVDLSFKTLQETLDFLPADLSRVTLLEQDILKTDFPRLWTERDRVIFFVDAHDLVNVPIMAHVLTTAVPALPDGSVVVIDDLWFSEERLTRVNARGFLENRVVGEIDELQCFHGHYAPYHAGGSFMGFAEVIPLLRFVNQYRIPLIHDREGKHAHFVWRKAYLTQQPKVAKGSNEAEGEYGSLQYNPLESVPVAGPLAEMMRPIIALYRQKNVRGAAESLSNALTQNPHDEGLSYGLAVCLARAGMLKEARDVLAPHLNESSHPRYRKLLDDLMRCVGSPEPSPGAGSRPPSEERGLTIFAMPKAFIGHTGMIQRNAIRSWARLDPKPQILLFGDEPGIREMAEEVGATHVPEVTRNEFGTPLVHGLFQAAEKHALEETLAYVNADMILFQDFADAAQRTRDHFPNFLLIGQRWDLPVLEKIDFRETQWRQKVLDRLAEHGMLHAECGLDYFVFRKGLWPEIPPFAIGRTAWDNWLVMDPRRRGEPVVDGTEFITAVHQEHDYGHVAGGRQEVWNGQEAAQNRSLAGEIDGFAYTTGAGWILDKTGHLIETRPRQPESGTVPYRNRRVAWLARQVEWLMARGEMRLAACKCEEMLTQLDKLAVSRLRGGAPDPLCDIAHLSTVYAKGCVCLAQCCMKLGQPEQVVASYTRLLEAFWVEIPPAQRDEMTRARDQMLEHLPAADVPSVCSLEPGCARDKRIALIVSIPERPEGLRGVIRDIEGQVDEIRIWLNEFDAAPKDLHDYRKVTRVETSQTGELFASGVWNLLGSQDEGYIFILDDDIVYPPDYVETMVAKIEEHQRRAVVVVHGMDFCDPFQDCLQDRVVYRFETARSRDVAVDAGGVGTTAFHTSTIRPQVRDFPNPNFRDLWFAVLAARRKTPIVCVARTAKWLCSRKTGGKQLWDMSHQQRWKALKNEVFRQSLSPLLDVRDRQGHVRRRDFRVFSFTNGRSTFDYSLRSITDSLDLYEHVHVFKDMGFLDAVGQCVELCDTPYFFKVDDDFILHPRAIAYMRRRVLEYPNPDELGIYYCHLWEDWTSRVRESIKIYSVNALRKIGGFKPDGLGKVDRTTIARLEEAGFKVVSDPSVVAIHACGTWQEQLAYERLWSDAAGQDYRKPTHEAMERYCGTKSLDEQYAMRLGLLERVNRQLDTPFHAFVTQGDTKASVTRNETPRPDVALSATDSEGVPVRSSGLTIFAMPKAFTGHTGMIQRNAIRSWTRLDPKPQILLFGDEAGIREMAEEVGATHIPEVARNEFGTPLVNELFKGAAHHAAHEVLAYVNADMILFEDFVKGIETVQARQPRFLLIGQRWDFPLLEEINFQDPQWRRRLQGQLQEHAMLHAECGLDYFVFRKGLWPEIPPFAIGRTAWDNWLVMDPHKRGVPVVDGTEFITAVHQDHDYGHARGGRHGAWNGVEAERNRSLAGQMDLSSLTTGATWVLRRDGSLARTEPRPPQYVTNNYRDQRTTWLVHHAKRLLVAGATELAASKCEETLACLDGWILLMQQSRKMSKSVNHADIAARFAGCHTLLAQCYMQMGRYEQVVATYNRLLENPGIRLSGTQRDSILRVRDQLARRLAGETQTANPISDQPCGDRGPAAVPSQDAESSTDRLLSGAPIVDSADRRPKVTVVTACRNGERFLRECVESVLNQTMPDWELFLVDDGSTDGTRRLIEAYSQRDARIHAHHFPDRRGPYVRRNFAISRAASDFIVIQDADDIMSPTKLERLFGEINKDNCLAMVGSFHRIFLEEFQDAEHSEPSELPLDHDTIVASCAMWRAGISHGMAIIRKSLFDTIGLYDENPFAADAFWSAKLALYAQTGAPVKMINIPEYLTLIRIHPGSQTQTLPVFDPRGRRARYRNYCECKLRRIREKWGQQAGLDIAAELRHCRCADFLTRFKAQIIEWESEALSAHFFNDLLTGALSCFWEKAHVSCVVILRGLEVMQGDIAQRVPGFNLLRGMAYYASQLPERSRTYLDQEIADHDNSLARKFLSDSREQGPQMDVQAWCTQNAPDLKLWLAGEERERVRVAMA